MLARKQRKSLQECRRSNTSREFVLWQVFFQEEVNYFHRIDYFLANIAFRIVQANAENPKSVKFEDYLLKFKLPEEEKEKEFDPEIAEQQAAASQSFWLGLVGMSKSGKSNKNKVDKPVVKLKESKRKGK